MIEIDGSLNYHIILRHNEETDMYSAYCLEMKNCKTEADTIKNTITQIKKVIRDYVDQPEDSTIILPKPVLYKKDKYFHPPRFTLLTEIDIDVWEKQVERMIKLETKIK